LGWIAGNKVVACHRMMARIASLASLKRASGSSLSPVPSRSSSPA
jgi:hypothetical protein